MPLLNILQFPDPRLKLVAEPIDTFDHEIFTLARDMLETMYESQGVGLAAIQVNVQKRIIAVDASDNQTQPMILINPEIIQSDGMIEWDEGCLSFPGVYTKIQRGKKITVHYYDVKGKKTQLEAEGLLGVCIQHEIDHLNGITFYDRLSSLKQAMMRKKLDKIRRKML